MLNDEDEALPGDVVPASLNMRLSRLCAYGNSMVVAMEEKKRFMDKVNSEQRKLIFYHDAYTVSAKL